MKHTRRVLRHILLLLCLTAVPLLVSCFGSGGGGGSSPKYSKHDFGDNDPNKVLVVGDSIVEGRTCESELSPFPSKIAAMTGMSVINSGVSGESSGRCAARTGGELDDDKPGFLLILTAHNDAIFDRDYDEVIGNFRSMIQAAKNRKVVPIVATCVPIHAPRSFATGPAEDYSVGIRNLCAEEQVPLVDLEKEFGDSEDLQCDGLHPNETGSTIIAAAFSDELP